jgi:DNA-binding transcriptional LysR family regulator
VSGSLVVDDGDALVAAVLQGQGLAYTFEHFVSDHIEAGRLVRVLDSWCPPLPGYHLYYPSRRKSAALAAFAETLREKSREQRF